jgi:transposase
VEEITTIGIDLGKSIFQVHAIGGAGRVIISKAVRSADFLVF